MCAGAIDVVIRANTNGKLPGKMDEMKESMSKVDAIDGMAEEMCWKNDAIESKVHAIEGSLKELKEMISQWMKMMG